MESFLSTYRNIEYLEGFPCLSITWMNESDDPSIHFIICNVILPTNVNLEAGGGVVSQLIKSLPSKHEDLSLTLQSMFVCVWEARDGDTPYP